MTNPKIAQATDEARLRLTNIRMRVDPELAAMQKVLNALNPLSHAEVARVFAFLFDKYQ